MPNEDETIWTVFNGEIYNHHELRCDLEARGHVFKGHSDTEVLPHLYEEEGPDFLNRLRGMFALAIYDLRTRTLLLSRDRFGIKPLFYAPTSHWLGFASEIRALLELPGIDDRPNLQAIHDFAALFYLPAPETFYAGIRAVQPGELVEAQLGDHGVSWRARTYYRWSITPDPGMSLAEAADRTDTLVTAAVHRQMESDVPMGTMLSGGIDSSLISAAAQTAISDRVRTFNVRFWEKDYDETWAALAVAKHIGSHHETLDMGGVQGNWNYITGLLLHAGQPFADTSLFAVNAVCRLMRQYVTVVLSGDGGDEGFGGYNLYRRIGSITQLQKFPALLLRGISFALAPLTRLGIVPVHHPQRIRDIVGADNISVIQNLFCPVHEDEHRKLCRDMNVLPVRRLFEPQWSHNLLPGASRAEQLSAHATEVNVRLELANDFLFKVDTASMKESLEVRVPMLDEDLFVFGLSLPHSLKARGQTSKVVLRTVAGRRLPSEVANKPKQGFGIPVDTWVNADFKAQMKDALLGPGSVLPDFFRPEVYQPMVEAFCEGRSYPGISRGGLYQRNIMLLSVQLATNPGTA